MDWNTILWSAIAFATGYATVMAAGPGGVYFSWPAVVSGLTALAGYHVGKGQDKGGVVNAAQKAIGA